MRPPRPCGMGGSSAGAGDGVAALSPLAQQCMRQIAARASSAASAVRVWVQRPRAGDSGGGTEQPEGVGAARARPRLHPACPSAEKLAGNEGAADSRADCGRDAAAAADFVGIRRYLRQADGSHTRVWPLVWSLRAYSGYPVLMCAQEMMPPWAARSHAAGSSQPRRRACERREAAVALAPGPPPWLRTA